jgi:hypothetical protein
MALEKRDQKKWTAEKIISASTDNKAAMKICRC